MNEVPTQFTKFPCPKKEVIDMDNLTMSVGLIMIAIGFIFLPVGGLLLMIVGFIALLLGLNSPYKENPKSRKEKKK